MLRTKVPDIYSPVSWALASSKEMTQKTMVFICNLNPNPLGTEASGERHLPNF